VGTSLENLSEKLQLKFYVNRTKIERVTLHAIFKNVVLRKTRLKFVNAITIRKYKRESLQEKAFAEEE